MPPPPQICHYLRISSVRAEQRKESQVTHWTRGGMERDTVTVDTGGTPFVVQHEPERRP
jgi:hypothetical protein